MRTTYQKHLGSECISYRSLHTGTGHIWITGSSAISKSKGVCVHSGGGAGWNLDLGHVRPTPLSCASSPRRCFSFGVF